MKEFLNGIYVHVCCSAVYLQVKEKCLNVCEHSLEYKKR